MICPFCEKDNDKVIDSRASEAGRVIRRRRECVACSKRFTTYERIEHTSRLMVVKRDGSRVPFDAERVLAGVINACGKRPVADSTKRRLVEEVEEELSREFEREVDSSVIGERVMRSLREIDGIAYIRFATEHLRMDTIEEIKNELEDLTNRPKSGKDQQELFKRGGSSAPRPA
ncbi:MAG: transcriptional regulator NrdR [Planctomycetota bacterium]|nr:transcriptional regulator NrdR [Planctomycetota bacterium]